ncbi:MAG: STAS domain-containing protein [Candidatus Krumholzibacteriota bacterium]
MRINIQHKGDISVVNLAGDFDGGKDCEKFQNTISGLLDDGCRKFILSFSLIRWINSCGLGKIVAIHTEVTDRGGRVILCNLEGRPLSVIYTARLFEVFEVRDSLRKALNEFETVAS